MKRTKLFLSLLIISLSLPCFAQTWTWAKSGTSTGSGYSEGFNVATDAAGNLYITGFYGPNITFGGITLNSNAGSTDVFITKYDPSGNVLWAKSAGGSGSEGGTSVATDAFGHVYLSGLFRSPTITFGSTTLTNAGNSDFFVAQYDSAGNVLWARGAGGAGFDETGDFNGNTVATDASGNVFVTGYFSSPSITFGATTLTNTGGNDVFIAKYDSSGNVLWAKNGTGTGDDGGTSVATDASGNVYLPGYFGSATITFGTHTLTNIGTGYSDMFLIKYDTAGNVIWATSAGVGIMTLNVPFNFCVATDAAKNVFVTGGFQPATVVFGAYTLNNNSVGGCNVFITKYDSAGTVLWAKSAGGNNYDCGYGVSTDPAGNVYMSGVYSLIGTTSITFGTHTLPFPVGGIDPMFIVKYDPNGNVLCASSLASGGDDNNGIAADTFGNAYITGDFMVDPLVVGSTSLNLTGGEDVFVAKYTCGSIFSVIPSAINPLCNGQCTGTATANPIGGTSPYTYSWSDGQTTASINNLCAGTYNVTITDFMGATAQSAVTITAPAPDTVTISGAPTSFCAGDSAQICASPGFITYEWNAGDTTSCIVAQLAGNYYVTATDANGCTVESNHIAIIVYTPPSVSISVNGDTLTSYNAVTYQWFLNGNVIPGATSQTYIAAQSGSYTVEVTDTNGCASVSNPVVISGIEVPIDNLRITIYPNPAINQITVGVNNELAGGKAEITDMLGRRIKISNIEHRTLDIELSDLSSGIYLVRIAKDGKQAVRKLAVE